MSRNSGALRSVWVSVVATDAYAHTRACADGSAHMHITAGCEVVI
jgi:hypothetical protein